MTNYTLTMFEPSNNGRVSNHNIFGLINLPLEFIDEFTTRFSSKKELFSFLYSLLIICPDPQKRAMIIKHIASGVSFNSAEFEDYSLVTDHGLKKINIPDDGFCKITYKVGDTSHQLNVMYAQALIYDEIGIMSLLDDKVDTQDYMFFEYLCSHYVKVTSSFQEGNVKRIKEQINKLKYGESIDLRSFKLLLKSFVKHELYFINESTGIPYANNYEGYRKLAILISKYMTKSYTKKDDSKAYQVSDKVM